jgi:hypothetical protein
MNSRDYNPHAHKVKRTVTLYRSAPHPSCHSPVGGGYPPNGRCGICRRPLA